MTTGALIFAFDNEQIDYVSMAAWSADNIHRHLGIPVCVVTDSDTNDARFDRIIRVNRTATDQQRQFADLDSRVTGYNQDRVDAYNLSPWDRTLVLDADYVVASPILKILLESPQSFLCHRSATDLMTGSPLENLNYFGRHRMPMWWATIMVFCRDLLTKQIFDCMRMVRDNWQHYRDLYAIGRSAYRNDFALSIALAIVTGHTLRVNHIGWSLATIMPDHELRQMSPDLYEIRSQRNGRPRRLTIDGMDFHAMGKAQLGAIVANPC